MHSQLPNSIVKFLNIENHYSLSSVLHENVISFVSYVIFDLSQYLSSFLFFYFVSWYIVKLDFLCFSPFTQGTYHDVTKCQLFNMNLYWLVTTTCIKSCYALHMSHIMTLPNVSYLLSSSVNKRPTSISPSHSLLLRFEPFTHSLVVTSAFR
mgnify:FL=1